ncbi:DedA family protein [Paenibacillus sp. GCM10027626]|uniref:DedA family protein n=1 Tax=Paenibacillus sp. GCM10027626 TaxID=3273411 RepID=UPI00363DEF36
MYHLEQLFNNYGYFVLFFGLLLEFIALPFPGETTMAFAGYLSYMGQLNWIILIIAAFFGTTIGMTITYFVGHAAGMPFIRKYGKWFFLSAAKIEKTEKWFGKYGNGLIFIGYFIPGVRHFTGYFSGIIRLPFRKFAAYAYSGALFWVIIFIWLGKFFGPQWNIVFKNVEHNALYIAIGVIVLLVILVLVKYRKRLFGK